MTGALRLLAEQPHSAPVQHWGDYLGWSAGLVLLVILVYWLMRQGWKWRSTLQSDLPPLPEAPEDPGPVLLTATGRYHGTTTAGNWLDRVVAHGLGARSLADLTLTERGLLVRRTGEGDLWIPAGALAGARTDSGIAGKVIPSGLLVVTWHHGDGQLDSGFRADHPDQHPAWVAAIEKIAATPAAARTNPTEGTS
ncbi:PH-like domain-containing protein [Peterkaempfera bronchialis]|uniref:PH-like domain-containing protein n=1 Tax=Peterkaempfera bronchialis TaxID=2126346 RepID=UPI00158D4E92